MSLTTAVGRTRRAVLGPVTYFAERPAPETPGGHSPFCTCCMLTNTFEAFKELFFGEGTFAVRLFAQRDEAGTANADSRVNGRDYPASKAALTAYASAWPDAGYEFRKQLVVIHDVSR